MLRALILPSRPSFAARSDVRCLSFGTSATAAVSVDRKSLYEVLRVKRDASQTEIKTAYRTLAKLHHPDAKSRFMDSTIASSSVEYDGDFIEIRNAYATLSDPDARAVYDSNLGFVPAVARVQSYNRSNFSSFRRWETDQCW